MKGYVIYEEIALKNINYYHNYIDELSKKVINLLNLRYRSLHMCAKEVKISGYNMIVRPDLEYASTSWNPYTKGSEK